MNKKPDIVSLKWVTGLMNTQADHAESALVEYSNDPSQKQSLLRCMWAVHQITSTLRALGMHKAEMLTLEMERSLNFLYKDKLVGERRKLAMGGLMQSLKIIPAYLDYTQSVRQETGHGLEQYVNDLRRWSGEKPRPRAFFFHMEIPPEQGITQDAVRASDEEIRARANVMLALYLEMAKQGLRRRNVGESMKTVARIARKMQLLFGGTLPERYWLTMIGLCEGIAGGLIVPDECIAQIFKSGAFAIKYARENGGHVDDSMDYDGYLQQMLYYIASCRGKPVHIARVREIFGIDESTLQDANHGLIHSDALLIAINGALGQLRTVMDFLGANDLGSLSRKDEDSAADLDDALEAVQAAEDRLIAAGQFAHADSLATVAKRFKALAGSLESGNSQSQANSIDRIIRDIVDVSLDLEHKLEHGLGSSVSGREYERRESVVNATFRQMGLVENALHQILRRKALKSALDKKPADAAGTLRLTLALNRYLNKSDKGHAELRQAVREADNGDPDLDLLHSLAAQFLDEQETLPDRRAIEQALASLDTIAGALQFAAMEREARVIERCHRWLAAASDAGEVREDDAFQCFAEAFAQLEMHMQRSLIDPLDDTTHMLALAEQRAAELGQFMARLSPGRKAAAVTAGASPQASLVKDAAIPPEFREVFIEESEEIVAELARLTGDWLGNPEANDVLRDIRRHFHTFKGNGRAVGANVLGELGWAAQDMLDRSLDAELAPTAETRKLVSEVVEALPALVESYSKEEGPDVERIRTLTNRCFGAASSGGDSSDRQTAQADDSLGVRAISTTEPLSH